MSVKQYGFVELHSVDEQVEIEGCEPFSVLLPYRITNDRTIRRILDGRVFGSQLRVNGYLFGFNGKAVYPADQKPARADMAHAIMGLVGENVALICTGLAAAAQTNRIVFGGTTLRNNESLAEILRFLTVANGHEAILLPDGEYTGAMGALALASE